MPHGDPGVVDEVRINAASNQVEFMPVDSRRGVGDSTSIVVGSSTGTRRLTGGRAGEQLLGAAGIIETAPCGRVKSDLVGGRVADTLDDLNNQC